MPIRQQRSEGVIRCDRKAIGRVLAKQRDVSCVAPVAHSSGSATLESVTSRAGGAGAKCYTAAATLFFYDR